MFLDKGRAIMIFNWHTFYLIERKIFLDFRLLSLILNLHLSFIFEAHDILNWNTQDWRFYTLERRFLLRHCLASQFIWTILNKEFNI